MSKISQTTNLGLTQYEGISDPIIYNDYSKDMLIIDESFKILADRVGDIELWEADVDNHLGTVDNSLNDVNETLVNYNNRLIDIEAVISTVSTQNIDDLIARLGALEIKVDNNANSISSLLDSFNGLTGQVTTNKTLIQALATRMTTAETDIAQLKQRCDNMLSTLVDHGARILTLEDCCENVQREIQRLEADIEGNAQDIATLATQIATIIDSKQDKLIEGSGISIVDNVISVVGSGSVHGSYDSATENLSLI